MTFSSRWDTYLGDNTASYYLHGNDIYIPLYYLFAPVYSHDMPDAFNYGGMGAWVGYYMVYALEDDCRFLYQRVKFYFSYFADVLSF